MLLLSQVAANASLNLSSNFSSLSLIRSTPVTLGKRKGRATQPIKQITTTNRRMAVRISGASHTKDGASKINCTTPLTRSFNTFADMEIGWSIEYNDPLISYSKILDRSVPLREKDSSVARLF